MKIAVFGAGAVGGHFAVRLANAGHDVSVVARGPHLAAIRADGLRLVSGEQELAAKPDASDRPEDLGAHDLVISTLKSTSLASLAAGLPPLLKPDTPVIFAQNGIPWWYGVGLSPARPTPPDLSALDPGGDLAAAVSPERIIGAVVISPNEVVAPGVVRHTDPKRNAVTIGEADDRETTRIVELRRMFVEAGLASPATGDIRRDIWAKILRNLTGSVLGVLTGQPAGPLMRDPRLHELTDRMLDEGIAVAAAHGFELGSLFADRHAFRLSGTDHKASILQDYLLGRPMEIASLVEAPIAFARAAGIATPTLDVVAALTVRVASDKGLYTA